MHLSFKVFQIHLYWGESLDWGDFYTAKWRNFHFWFVKLITAKLSNLSNEFLFKSSNMTIHMTYENVNTCNIVYITGLSLDILKMES